MTTKLEQAARQALEALEEIHVGNMTPMAEENWNKAITALREALGNSLKPKCFADYQPNHAIDRACASCAVAVECQTGEQAEQEPVAYLGNGTRFKVTLTDNDCYISGLPQELGGRWVALVAAENDCHLTAAPVQQVTRADLKAAFKEGFERAADLYASKDVQEQAEQDPFAYEVWDENDQVLILIYASYLKEAPWLEEDDIIRKLYTAPVRTKDLDRDEIEEVVSAWWKEDATKTYQDLCKAAIAADREKNK